jgi:coronin-1B/1C/6
MPRDLPLITGHSGAILDHEFNPFSDNMLATASEDMMVKVWQIPDDGFKAHTKEAAAVLEGHGKKVSFCTWNPVASNILASTAYDSLLKTWDIEDAQGIYECTTKDQVWSLKWNYTGSMIGYASKDKKLHIVDPRKSEHALSSKVHDGSKAIKLEWMGRPENPDDAMKVITTGFSSQAERQINVWDLRKFGEESAEPLNTLVLDQGTGALLPKYDAGTGLLFVAGKGDANCRYFEMDAADPYIHFVSQYGGKDPSKGFDFLPKRCVDTTTHEVMRGIQLQANAIIPISFKVPRKSEAFQEDIFPDCPSGEPSMSGGDWAGGSECNSGPKTQSMRPGTGGGERRKTEGSILLSAKELRQQLEKRRKESQNWRPRMPS